MSARTPRCPTRLGDEDVAFVMYTSGTTGPPKGVQIPRRAIETNLDALAEIWRWTDADRVAQALPVFHVHGLVIGMLGPLRRGGQVEHIGRFSPGGLAEALRRGATMVFGVPDHVRAGSRARPRGPSNRPTRSPAHGCRVRARRRCPPPFTSGSAS